MSSGFDDEQKLDFIAYRCFRDTADFDYIHARLAYNHKLFPQFLWSSLHCLEKYGKCILLLNRIKAKNIGHKITPSIMRFEDETDTKIFLSNETIQLIEKLEERARFRYLETGSHIVKGDLLRLDKAVHEIRRYCQKFHDNPIEKQIQISKLSNQNITEHKINQINSIKLECGQLEEIIADKNHPSRHALIYQNAFFKSRNRSSVKIRKNLYFYNSPFNNFDNLVDIAKDYIYLPKEIIQAHQDESL